MLNSILMPVLQPLLRPIFGGGGLANVLYPPSVLNNKLILWADFEDTSTMTFNGNRVQNLIEKSSNLRPFINPILTQSPEYDSVENALRFYDLNLSAPTFLYNNSEFLMNLATGFRVFAVLKVNSLQNGSGGNILSVSKQTAGNPYVSTLVQNGDAPVPVSRDRQGSIYRGTGSFLLTEHTTRGNIPSVSDIEYKVISMQDNVNNVKHFSNLVEISTTNYTRTNLTAGLNRTTIGCLFRDIATNVGYRGFLKQLVATTNDLTNSELINLDAWLQSRLPIPQNSFLLNSNGGYLLASNNNRLILG